MAIYSYRASTLKGVIVDGVIEAADQRTAIEKLKNSGIIIIRINAQGKDLKASFLKSSKEDLLTFTTELSTLLGAGLALDASLGILSEISESTRMKDIIKSIIKSLREGSSFSDSLQKHPGVFPKLYVNMVRAGEAGGVLDVVLDKLNEFLETTKELKEHVITSMIYPAILLATGSISIIILLTFMVPKFNAVFSDLGTSMPLSTRLLLYAGSMLQAYWWVIFLSAIAGWLILGKYVKSDIGRYKLDSFKLRIPGEVVRKLETARFCRVLGTLLKSGVPMLQALNNSKDVVNNQVIVSAVSTVSKAVKEGRGINIPLSETGVFPPLAISMIKVGEETGQLDDMLIKVAITYEKNLKASIRKFLSFLEPVMILVMGVVIGFIVLSMLMGIFSISDIPF